MYNRHFYSSKGKYCRSNGQRRKIVLPLFDLRDQDNYVPWRKIVSWNPYAERMLTHIYSNRPFEGIPW